MARLPLPLLAAVVLLLALPAVAQAAETIEYEASSSYATNGFSHTVKVDISGGTPSASLQVLWSLNQNNGGATPQAPVPVTLDGSGNATVDLTYTPSYAPGTNPADVISALCADDNSSGACDTGEPTATVYATHTIFVGEANINISGTTSFNTGATTNYTATASYYGGGALAGVTLNWSRSGANGSASGTVMTDGSGQITVPTWTGTNPGQDTLRVWLDDPLGTASTYDSGEGTDVSNVVFTSGTITLSSLSSYYLANGAGTNLTATVYTDGNNGNGTPTTLAGSGVAVLYQINGGAVVSDVTDASSQITIPVTQAVAGSWQIYVWRDVVNANNATDTGEPTSFTSTTFRRPSVSNLGYSPYSYLGIGQTETLSFQAQNFDFSAYPSQNVCYVVVSGPNAGKHGVVATNGTGNGSLAYTSSALGTDNLAFWLQSEAACGLTPPSSPTNVTYANVNWVMAIASSGPVTAVYMDSTLHCQARYGVDVRGEFYGTDWYATGSCHPFVIVDGVNHGFQAVSQSAKTAVAGGGFKVVTVACVVIASSCGPSGTDPYLTQTVTYFPGDNFYRTDYAFKDRDNAQHTVRIYQYADCYLQGSDSGDGFHSNLATGGNGGVYCSQNANNSPQGRIEGFVPLDAGASFYEAGYSVVSGAVTSAAGKSYMFDNSGDVSNTCQCTTFQDNGMALGWQATLAANGTLTRSLLTDFSPSGVIADITAPTVTLDAPADGSHTTAPQPVFSGQAGAAAGDSATVTVDVYSGTAASGTPVTTLTATRSGTSWSVPPASALALGTYTARASQSDNAGNVGQSAPRTFTIDAPPAPPPPPPKVLPPPVFSKRVNVQPVSGAVLVKVPGTSTFVPLKQPSQIAVGSIIDATDGRVRLFAVDKKGKLQSADFFEGVFKVVQLAKDKGVTQLNLVDAGARLCKKSSGKSARAAAKKKAKPKSLGHLWGQGKGLFRTKGRYASATIRGTTWDTDDRCDGTLVKVKAGVVSVTDLVKNRTLTVRKGDQYLAKPGKG